MAKMYNEEPTTKSALAPIALFCYNRLGVLERTVDALKNNVHASESELYIFSDGWINNEDRQSVSAVRQYIRTITGFKRIHIVESEYNMGLSVSLIAGITSVIETHDKIIVVEDDIITSTWFLKYMNDALDLYENETDVISVNGYLYPVEVSIDHPFFIKGAECWGWGTWKRGWDIFESDGGKLLQSLKKEKREKEFDYNGSYKFTKMLKKQTTCKIDSWAIRWYASAFLANKLTLFPNVSLVKNIGFGGGGTNCHTSNIYDVDVSTQPIQISNIEIKESEHTKEEIGIFLRKLAPPLLTRISRRITCQK